MPSELLSDAKFELGHVLFMDIVGYSKLLINEQSEQLQTLNRIVRSTEQFRLADAEGKLLRLPTGDGGALVFRTNSEAPVLCALEIARELQKHPELRVRMGVHSGPVNRLTDLNQQANIAGDGINVAQRVMDCGDAGHILVSKRIVEDLGRYQQWRRHLHDLGECKVKHGLRVHLTNLYTDEVGNRTRPKKLQIARRRKTAAIIAAFVLAALLISLGVFLQQSARLRKFAATIPKKSIAVLPFQNLSEDKTNAYFADGIQEEILTRLTQIADLKVISRTSTQGYQSKPGNLAKIAQQLGVANILEGSVQKAADQVRVNVQLVNGQTDFHIWAETYDRKLTDIFAVESDIAKRIAESLQAKLSPKEKTAINERPTSDLAAYDLYLQGKELVYQGEINPSQQRENLFKAVQLLEQAVTADPAFLLAHCQLAATHDLLYFFNYDHTENRLKLAEASIENAIRVNPDAAQTHLAQAIHSYWGYLDYNRARDELTKAQQSLPNDAQVFKFLGLIDRRQGRWNEAVRNLQRVVELDPRNVDGLGNLAQAYFDLRNYRESIAMFDRIAELEPGNPAAGTFRASIELYARADVAPLRDALNRIEAEGPAAAADVAPLSFDLARYERDPTAAARAVANIPREGYTDPDSAPFPHAWFEGLLAELRSDAPAAQSAFTVARAETEKIVRAQPKNEKPLSVLALIDAHLGQKEKAIQEGRTACDMLPVATDAVSGVLLASNLARIYAVTGENNLALQELDTVTTLPGGITYGDLRLDPVWDPLRGDPRFEKIVASLAPGRKAAR